MRSLRNFLTAGLLVMFLQCGAFAQKAMEVTDPPRILEFLGDQPMTRVGRPFTVLATISNPAPVPINDTATLRLPEGIHFKGEAVRPIQLASNETVTLRWTLLADKPVYGELLLEINNQRDVLAVGRLPVRFLPQLKKTEAAYLPEPVPLKKNTRLLIGAHNCPLWEADSYERWSQLIKHPERTPALGFYAQENPQVADWETKWAVEHGVDFFVYCWYRDGQGGPVKQRFGSALHQALFNSRFQSYLKFTIMWENQRKGRAGVANEDDLMNNLLPFWMDNYFKRSNYLVVDNKPVLFIYRPEFLVDDLGSVENVRSAFEKMRKASRACRFRWFVVVG